MEAYTRLLSHYMIYPAKITNLVDPQSEQQLAKLSQFKWDAYTLAQVKPQTPKITDVWSDKWTSGFDFDLDSWMNEAGFSNTAAQATFDYELPRIDNHAIDGATDTLPCHDNCRAHRKPEWEAAVPFNALCNRYIPDKAIRPLYWTYFNQSVSFDIHRAGLPQDSFLSIPPPGKQQEHSCTFIVTYNTQPPRTTYSKDVQARGVLPRAQCWAPWTAGNQQTHFLMGGNGRPGFASLPLLENWIPATERGAKRQECDKTASVSPKFD